MDVTTVLGFLIFVFLSIGVHECAHAWAADKLGDPTAKYQGRLSLNPLVHLDPLGTLMILTSVFYGFGIGWGKPVPVNPYNFRMRPRVGMALVALAGPLSNLLLAVALAIPVHLAGPIIGFVSRNTSIPSFVLSIIGFLISLLITGVLSNIGLALFNLLPLPPLDGFSVVMGILSTIRNPKARQFYYQLSRLEMQGPLVLFALLALDYILPINILGSIIGPLFRLLSSLILW